MTIVGSPLQSLLTVKVQCPPISMWRSVLPLVLAVKYLYKYVYKSHDKAIVGFRSVDNADNSGPKRKDEVEKTWKSNTSLPLSHAIEYLLMNSMLICRM